MLLSRSPTYSKLPNPMVILNLHLTSSISSTYHSWPLSPWYTFFTWLPGEPYSLISPICFVLFSYFPRGSFPISFVSSSSLLYLYKLLSNITLSGGYKYYLHTSKFLSPGQTSFSNSKLIWTTAYSISQSICITNTTYLQCPKPNSQYSPYPKFSSTWNFCHHSLWYKDPCSCSNQTILRVIFNSSLSRFLYTQSSGKHAGSSLQIWSLTTTSRAPTQASIKPHWIIVIASYWSPSLPPTVYSQYHSQCDPFEICHSMSLTKILQWLPISPKIKGRHFTVWPTTNSWDLSNLISCFSSPCSLHSRYHGFLIIPWTCQ